MNQKQESLKKSLETNEANSTTYHLQLLAHDLRSPIISIINISEFALTDFENLSKEELLKYFDIIYKQSSYADCQIKTLLSLDFDQKQHIKKTEPFSISTVFDTLIKNNSELVNRKSIKISQHIEFNPDLIDSNKSGVEIILGNCLNNAIKFTAHHGQIKLIAIKNHKNVELHIQDNGTGISQSHLSQIFDSSISQIGTDGENGLGIGLSLCKKIADTVDIDLSIESELHKGTTARLIVNTDHKK